VLLHSYSTCTTMNKQVLSNKKIPIDIRRRLYQAIVVNVALWGNESWALMEENRKKVETFHHSCLRRMYKWTMLAIAEKGITNEQVRRAAGNSPTMESMMMEVRRLRWLSKLSAMEKSISPRRMLGAWCQTPRPIGNRSRPYATPIFSLSKSLALNRKRANKGMDDPCYTYR
jgi:hypothetical protein